ncbi:MAG: hypothetical protein MZU97_04665 [Bacillus subtilis]|nr:hypothetical protein [Bacillus subtilis]
MLDLYLIHAPKPWHIHSDAVEYTDQNIETWKAFVELYRQRQGPGDWRLQLRRQTSSPDHRRRRSFRRTPTKSIFAPARCKKKRSRIAKPYGILIEAYSPFATGRLFKVENVPRTCRSNTASSPAQLAVRWSLQSGHLPLPKSVTPRTDRQQSRRFWIRDLASRHAARSIKHPNPLVMQRGSPRFSFACWI